jgi:predicted TIM-barrel fold metal-dependent hydrolase
MTKRAIIDPHHHLWDLQRNRYPWLQQRPLGPSVAGDIAKIAHDYLLDDYMADTAAFDLRKSVHVEAAWDPADPVGETRWLQSVADQRGFPHGIVAHADLQAADVERLLASHAQFANVRGIR